MQILCSAIVIWACLSAVYCSKMQWLPPMQLYEPVRDTLERKVLLVATSPICRKTCRVFHFFLQALYGLTLAWFSWDLIWQLSLVFLFGKMGSSRSYNTFQIEGSQGCLSWIVADVFPPLCDLYIPEQLAAAGFSVLHSLMHKFLNKVKKNVLFTMTLSCTCVSLPIFTHTGLRGWDGAHCFTRTLLTSCSRLVCDVTAGSQRHFRCWPICWDEGQSLHLRKPHTHTEATSPDYSMHKTAPTLNRDFNKPQWLPRCMLVVFRKKFTFLHWAKTIHFFSHMHSERADVRFRVEHCGVVAAYMTLGCMASHSVDSIDPDTSGIWWKQMKTKEAGYKRLSLWPSPSECSSELLMDYVALGKSFYIAGLCGFRASTVAISSQPAYVRLAWSVCGFCKADF